LGHKVKLIPPQFVKPFVQDNKNNYNTDWQFAMLTITAYI